MADGTRGGETNISASTGHIKELHLVPRDVQPLPQTLAAIASADLITIGPDATPASAELKTKWRSAPDRSLPVDGIEALGVNVILGDYLEEVDCVARHATERGTRPSCRCCR